MPPILLTLWQDSAYVYVVTGTLRANLDVKYKKSLPF